MSQAKQASLFSEENAVSSNFITWGAPGDYVAGTLVSTRLVENNLPDKKGEMQTIYEIKVSDGAFHKLDDKKNPVPEVTKCVAGEFWNVGGKKGIDAQMRNVKIGQILGMKFMEETPSKTKGYNPTKVVKIFTEGLMDTEWMTSMDTRSESDKQFDAITGK